MGCLAHPRWMERMHGRIGRRDRGERDTYVLWVWLAGRREKQIQKARHTSCVPRPALSLSLSTFLSLARGLAEMPNKSTAPPHFCCQDVRNSSGVNTSNNNNPGGSRPRRGDGEPADRRAESDRSVWYLLVPDVLTAIPDKTLKKAQAI